MGSLGSLSSVDEFLAQSYDYLIVGGGTAGLVVASRLSDDPNVTVGVIEAGAAALDDSNIINPAKISAMLNNPSYDWSYQSTPQTGNLNHTHHIPRGKVLGGSSAINFMAYGKPSTEDIDDWGNGWSWANLGPYFKRSEKLETATVSGKSSLCPVNPDAHGSKGTIHTSLGPWQSPVETDLLAAMDKASGLRRPQEPWSGEHQGFYRSLFTVDRTGLPRRSYAANGYLQPVLYRSNLRVLTNAFVAKILLDDDACAHGVEFLSGGSCHRVSVSREVILSAGTLESPKLLELSGIGDPDHLASLGISCRVPLPAVGRNLQEKPVSAVVYELADGVLSMDSIIRDKSLFEQHMKLLQTEHTGAFTGPISLMGFVPYGTHVPPEQLHKTVASVMVDGINTPSSATFNQRQQIAAHLLKPRSSDIQLVGIPTVFGIDRAYQDCSKLNPGPPPGRNACYSLMVSSMYPVSRGSAHAQSTDASTPPRVDFGFLTHPADVDVLASAVVFGDGVFQSPSMRGRVKARLQPPPEVDLEDFVQAREYVCGNMMSYHHAVGTCALGEVVDESLRVKGTKGLRAVDASVIPMQVSHAILATVYAVAEKAVDLILATE